MTSDPVKPVDLLTALQDSIDQARGTGSDPVVEADSGEAAISPCNGVVEPMNVEPPDEEWEDEIGECWQAQCSDCDWYGPRRGTLTEAVADVPIRHREVKFDA